jgi:uncharacterized protein involved in exopolysaccharide biosynthesis
MTSVGQSNGANGRHHDVDSFDVMGSLRRIGREARNQKWLVLAVVLLTLGMVTAYVIIWPPVYEATAMLMVERDTDPVRDSFYIGWNVFRKDDARTEIELMTAGPILKEVVDREHLTYDDVYHPFSSHATYLWQESAVGKKYKAVKQKVFGDEDGGKDAPTKEELALGRTIVDLKAGIDIEPVGESNVGRITVKGPSRRVAAIANRLVEVYLGVRMERYRSEAQRSYDVLTTEVKKCQAELGEIEAQRLEFTKKNDLALDLQKAQLELSKLTEREDAIASTRTRIATLEATVRELDQQLADQPPERTTAKTYNLNAVREATKLKRLELETQLIQARNRFVENSPEVTEIKQNIAKLDALIAGGSEMVESEVSHGLNVIREELVSKRTAAQADLAGAYAGLGSMVQTAQAMKAQLAEVPEIQAKLRVLDRNYALAQEKYKEVMAKQAQASVSLSTATATMSSMRVVESAVPPASKTAPKIKILYPVALVAGLVMGIGLALVRSYGSGRVARDDVKGGRGMAPLYCTIRAATKGRPLAVSTGVAPRLRALEPETADTNGH